MNAERPPAFVDTNVLVYALERADSPRKSAARRLVSELIEEDRLRTSTQVLQELFVTLTAKVRSPCSHDEAMACLEDLAGWPFFVVDYAAIRDAGLLARDARLSFWDSLIVVAAARSGASVLYSEDLSHGQIILGVQIQNPFRDSAG